MDILVKIINTLFIFSIFLVWLKSIRIFIEKVEKRLDEEIESDVEMAERETRKILKDL